MSDSVAEKRCDECGRVIIKYHRVHKEIRYCACCYARVFKKRKCPSCNKLMRLPSTDLEAICLTCQASLPCVRCERVGAPIGCMTSYGPVCASCSPYFRLLKSCHGCGKLSSKLSRVRRLENNLLLCLQCQRSGYGTCSNCRRYRLLIDGDKKICKLCNEMDRIPCVSCGELMPAGRVTRCENCYWMGLAHKRLSINRHIFSLPSMADIFNEFGGWLISQCGAKVAALSLSRYLNFFLEVERAWGLFPNYQTLVGYFTAEGLRREQRPMRWLYETQGYYADDEIRENTSEENRIVKSLATFSLSSKGFSAIKSYEAQLRVRQHKGKITLRSIRLALTPAVKLLQMAISAGRELPDQSNLDDYLMEHPGQKAAVTGFINHINAAFGLALKVHVDAKRVRQYRKKKLEKKLLLLINDNEKPIIERFSLWIPIAMEYFHGLRMSRNLVATALNSVVVVDDFVCSLRVEGKEYYLPRLIQKPEI